jgi:hypothetical protein
MSPWRHRLHRTRAGYAKEIYTNDDAMATVSPLQNGRAKTRAGSGIPLSGGGAEESGSIRQILLLLIVVGAVGLAVELFLLEHTESVWQWIPLVALGGGLGSAVAVAVRPHHGTMRCLQVAMTVIVGTGLLGLYLHYQGNAEFELEMDPVVRGPELLWRSLRGATPALAPGALAQLGLLGLVYAYRHPVLRRGRGAAPGDTTD